MNNELINRTWFDRQTKIDELLVEVTKATRATNATLSSIASSLGAEVPVTRRHEDSNYPLTGKKSLPANETLFLNIKTGAITFSSGADVEYMTQPIPDTLCRSIYIYTDRTINIELYEEDRPELTTSILPLQWRKIFVEFNTVKIKNTAPTNIYIIVSTEPEGVPEVNISDYYEGNPYVTRGTLVMGVPTEIDIWSNLGRSGSVGFLANVGPAVGDIQVLEHDGISWTTTYYTIVKDGVENFEKADISKLKLTAVTADAVYELNMR